VSQLRNTYRFPCRSTICAHTSATKFTRSTTRARIRSFARTNQKMKIETLAVHAGHTIDSATGAVSFPIYLSTTFQRDVEGTYSRGFMYSRNNNPNRQALEKGISAFEGGAGAAAFASGTGASMSIFQALAPGDHVLAHVDAYYGTSRLLREIFQRWGLDIS